MDATASKPTVLAKLLGFYTVEIKNMETGTTQAKADLLVMENLFYKQETVKTFDLKGIQGRKVKAASSSSGSKTLFDGDWIEGKFPLSRAQMTACLLGALCRTTTSPDASAAILQSCPPRGHQS